MASVETVPEKVTFRFHPRAMAALGRDLVTNDVVAVMELVKNSYDALASRVDVRIYSDPNRKANGYIEIADDGHGMDYATIRDVWCVIATPFRQQQATAKMHGRSRSVTGEKGLGRLSAARLGAEISITTKTESGPILEFSMNWDDLVRVEDLEHSPIEVSMLPSDAFEGRHGTRITIIKLRENWGEDKIEELRRNLARLISPFAQLQDFNVWLNVLGTEGAALQAVEPPPFMSQPKYSIRGMVDNDGQITCCYQYRRIGEPVSRESTTLESWQDLYGSTPITEKFLLNRSNPGCGPFEFELRAWDLRAEDTRDIAEHFGENRRYIRGAIREQQGISVYRDNILVLPKSDATRDWLGLDLRRISRVGPRLSTSQIVGFVQITKSGNPQIIDTSDREGLVVNTPSRAFGQIIKRIVEILENERQIDRTQKEDTGPSRELFANLTAKPLVEKLETLRDSKKGDLTDAIAAAKSFDEKLERDVVAIERRFGYYNRLAVIGTIAQIVIHEIRNRTTVIGRGLRKAGELAHKVANRLVCEAIDMSNTSVEALEHLADRFAPLANRKFRSGQRNTLVTESITRCVDMLEPELRSFGVEVEIPSDADTTVRADPGEFDAIILNLVSNSIYWMQKQEGNRRLRFRMRQGPRLNRVTISVDDSGPGIDPEDLDRIFWPGVTRRPDGIGMGLTVASELVDGHGGTMQTMAPGELGGATFEFDLPVAKKSS